MPPKGRREHLDYDDRLSEDDPLPINGRVPMPKTPDEADVRWVRGERGYVSLRDPFTGERHEVPTKYAEGAGHLAAGLPGPLARAVVPAPFWMVRRAMEKLPPKAPLPALPAEPKPKPPLHLDDDGPL